MRNNKIFVLWMIGLVLVLAMLFNVATAATECTGRNCALNTTLVVGNAVPSIYAVQQGLEVTPTGMSTGTTYVWFNVSDANGYGDLNSSSATCVGYKSGEISRNSTSCTPQNQSGVYATYNCTVTFQYYDAAASDWKWNCSISDNLPALASNATVVFIVNSVNYVQQDAATFAWSNALVNTADQEAASPVTLTNGGNQNYGSASVTAYDAVDAGLDVIPTEDFALSSATGTPAGTSMVNATATAITTWFDLPHGSGSTEQLFAYVDMPSVPTGSYSSTNDWLMAVST